MDHESWVRASLEFIKFLQKRKLKLKDAILQNQGHNTRATIFRTDNLNQVLKEDDYDQIQNIFKSVYPTPITKFNEMLELFNTLSSLGILLRLDRAPQTIPGPLYKWPKQVIMANVY